MVRLLHHSSILLCSLLAVFQLMSCNEKSEQVQALQLEQVQDAKCKQVMDIFAIADWDSLATKPFVETGSSTSLVPAQSLIAGFNDCSLWKQKFSLSEGHNYICEAPAETAFGGDIVAAAKAFAAEWKSCFAGWQETFKIYNDPNSRDRPVTSFKKNDDALPTVTFQSTMDYQTVMNAIWITKSVRK